MNMKGRIGISDVLLPVFSILYLVGIRTVFHPCGPKEDGSWMTCHWAGQMVTGLAVVLVVLSVAHVITTNTGVKLGLDLGILAVSVYSALIPGKLISLCMMPDMRCHQLMTPGVIICSILVLAAVALDCVLIGRKGSSHAL